MGFSLCKDLNFTVTVSVTFSFSLHRVSTCITRKDSLITLYTPGVTWEKERERNQTTSTLNFAPPDDQYVRFTVLYRFSRARICSQLHSSRAVYLHRFLLSICITVKKFQQMKDKMRTAIFIAEIC